MPFVRRLRRSLVLRTVFILWILVTTAIFFGNSLEHGQRASATAEVKATVIQAIAMSKDSDLDFGTLVQGAGEAAIVAGPQNRFGTAVFSVAGEPGREFSINLPDDQSVALVTGAGEVPQKRLRVYQFNAFPATGLLNNEGKQRISVGATRSASLLDQVPGDYRGHFTITVIY